MRKKEIEEMLEELGIPFRYHHFTQKEMENIELPIIVWNCGKSSNFFADGIVYQKIQKLDIELYTDQKDWDLEERLEHILDAHGITWEKTASEWIQTESMWEALYEMEV